LAAKAGLDTSVKATTTSIKYFIIVFSLGIARRERSKKSIAVLRNYYVQRDSLVAWTTG
jgi:hypothetical protein